MTFILELLLAKSIGYFESIVYPAWVYFPAPLPLFRCLCLYWKVVGRRTGNWKKN